MDRQRGHLGTKASLRLTKRIKILSLGDVGCGKSCLIKRYCEGRFVPEYVTTIGIDYGVKTVKYENEEIKVNFWDIGGDPIYFDIRNEFYKDTHGVILVYDVSVRSGFDRIQKWIDELKGYANTNVILFLVANKIDLEPRVVEMSEGQTVARNLGAMYFETSAATGQGVADMFDRLFLSASSTFYPAVQANGGVGTPKAKHVSGVARVMPASPAQSSVVAPAAAQAAGAGDQNDVAGHNIPPSPLK